MTNAATVNGVAAKVSGLPSDKTGETLVDSAAAAATQDARDLARNRKGKKLCVTD